MAVAHEHLGNEIIGYRMRPQPYSDNMVVLAAGPFFISYLLLTLQKDPA